jgi:hypothetical protein
MSRVAPDTKQAKQNASKHSLPSLTVSTALRIPMRSYLPTPIPNHHHHASRKLHNSLAYARHTTKTVSCSTPRSRL